jgi:hypothetical protein
MHKSRFLVLAAAPIMVVLAASQVLAYAFGTGPLVPVSGPSPFAGCTVGGTPSSTLYPEAEVEPFVAVNPTNSNNVIGVFQQDRWSDGGSRGLLAARSINGGTSWTTNFAAFSTCSGNPASNTYERASDPWVTFDTAGNAYQISLSVSGDQVLSSVLVAKSADGGATWSSPTTLLRDPNPLHFNDKESITGDPTRAGYVYAVWDRGTFPSEQRNTRSFRGSHAFRGQPMFSRTTDGGQTWSAPVGMANQNIFTIGNQIAVLRDGTLVDVFQKFQGSGVQPSPQVATESVMLSRDAGLTWSQPIDIALWFPEAVSDPDNGNAVRTGNGLPDIAVDSSTGTIYVVWEDGRFSADRHADVALSKSVDGGRKWSPPSKVNQSPVGVQAFTPAVAVSADGTVGITYYDFRNNTSALGVPTDAWFAHSHDSGATWSEQHVSGSFDIETAPVARGYFLGDYEGLATVGNDFLTFFVQTNSGNFANPTDVFSLRLSK